MADQGPSPIALRDGDEIPAGYLLLRTIPRDKAHWVDEESRPTGFNFCPSTTQEHLSMKLAVAYPAEEVLDDHPGFGLLEVDVASLTSRGCRVVFTPSEGRGHVSVYGLKGGNQIRVFREICG